MSIGFGFERLGLLTLKYPIRVALVVLAFTVLTLSQIPKISIDSDIMRIYNNSGEYFDRYDDLSKSFGTFENDAYVLVSSPNLADPKTIEILRELSFDLELTSYAVGTLTPFSLRRPTDEGSGSVPAVSQNMQSKEEVRAKLLDLRENDEIMRNLIGEDLDSIVMIMFPDQELTKGKGEQAMLDELNELILEYQSSDIHIELTGQPVWKAEMLRATINDQIKFSTIGFLIGALMSLIALRSFWGAILATLTPLLSVIWVMGSVILLFGSFTFLTNVVITLVLVIAFAESMYFCFTWLRLWNEGMEPNEAITQTLLRITPAAALTAITTMVAFLSLTIAQGDGIKEFAYSGFIAVAVSFITLVTFLPLALKLALKLGFKAPKKMSIAVQAPIPVARFLTNKYAKPISIISILVMLALLFPHFALEPRFDFKDYLPKESQALSTAQGIDENVGGVAPIYIKIPLKGGMENVTDDDFLTIQKVHAILEENIGKGKVISAASFSAYSDLGFSRERIFRAVGPFLKRRFITDDGNYALVTGFLPTLLESNKLREIVISTDKALIDAGITDAKVSGFNVLSAFTSTDIIRSLRNGLTIAILINILIIGLAFQSWRIALVAIIPNFLPILGTELYLYTSGAGLQLTTVIALTIAFGIAVNDTIHFLASYMHARKNGFEHQVSVNLALKNIGPALVATTLILCAGTFVVIFSTLPQVALFGTLLVITFVLALLADLFILPALLIAGGRFFKSVGANKNDLTK
ncbi:MAG: MMPL family transporter [Devosiaceae bacterium]|nr:MMPL family transporter [Devosiaceae bacterium]